MSQESIFNKCIPEILAVKITNFKEKVICI